MTCRFRRQLGVGIFLGQLKKKLNWLPTMATRWEKQLSLSKEMNSNQNIKEKFDLKEQPENRTTSSSIIFSNEVLKDANQ